MSLADGMEALEAIVGVVPGMLGKRVAVDRDAYDAAVDQLWCALDELTGEQRAAVTRVVDTIAALPRNGRVDAAEAFVQLDRLHALHLRLGIPWPRPTLTDAEIEQRLGDRFDDEDDIGPPGRPRWDLAGNAGRWMSRQGWWALVIAAALAVLGVVIRADGGVLAMPCAAIVAFIGVSNLRAGPGGAIARQRRGYEELAALLAVALPSSEERHGWVKFWWETTRDEVARILEAVDASDWNGIRFGTLALTREIRGYAIDPSSPVYRKVMEIALGLPGYTRREKEHLRRAVEIDSVAARSPSSVHHAPS